MIYYLVLFVFIILMSTIVMHLSKENHRVKVVILNIIIVLLISLFAGFRDSSVGTDVGVYVIPNIERYKYFKNYIEYLKSVSTEPLFSTITFFNAKISSSPFITLFLSQLLIIAPLYATAWKYKDKLSIPLFMFVYCFFIFNLSLSIMRQLIASSLVIFSMYGLTKNRILKLALLVIAILFHYSVIILILSILTILLLKKHSILNRYYFVIVALFLMLSMLINPIFIFLANNGIISSKYLDAYQIINSQVIKNFSIFEICLRVALIFMPTIILFLIKRNKAYIEIIILSIIGLILSLSAISSQYFVRISYPFYLFIPFLVSFSLKNSFLVDRNGCVIYSLVLIGMFLLYWLIIYISWNYFGTANFIFR